MKKFVLIALMSALTACAFSPNVNWKQGSLAVLAQIDIQLKSNLWTDQLPKVQGAETQSLNGTLTLETSGELPADLNVNQLVIKQGDQVWTIDGDNVELRTQSEDVWEVVFQSSIEVNVDKPVSVALELSNDGKNAWLVEHNVSIDKVY
ncbi:MULTISPECIES: hypothetical protein [Vibrio]|uniref:DNA polymerase III subunit beta n=2 Tax=Vibrio TaxID=662 RepID=A0A7X4LH15_9VIBR|nr:MULTISPECIES: hypothetical protein [Vibrio]MBF9001558.1 hypothetical protein [Vibrio nitrifigilis]MZI91768.1 hypothetical protein [Vibrio eleionomae]